MTVTPEIPGYEFDQRLLDHPVAEVWRGRSFTGMEVVALVLSPIGAADPKVRERLDQASRDAALAPAEDETPLWAANLNASRPYAITQLVPGQSGAERLFDPLDGLLGNDQVSLDAVRDQLAQYGAVPPPPAERPWGEASQVELPHYTDAAAQQSGPSPAEEAGPATADAAAVSAPQGRLGVVEGYRRRLGGWAYLVVVVGVLIIFSVLYSIGAAIGSAVKDPAPAVTQGPASAPVSPGPLPSPAVKPGITKARTPEYRPFAAQVALVGATYQRGADVQVVEGVGLPFAFGWPRPPSVIDLGESSYAIYRRVLTGEDPAASSTDARIAVHPCRDLARCLAERTAFDRHWTAYFKVDVTPRTAKDKRTWTGVRATPGRPYAVSMTRAFQTGRQWWLVGVMVTGQPGEEPAIQRVLNDLRTQTP